MSTNLQTLPTEIVQIIAKHLSHPELYSLRLVCKDLYKKSTWNFAQLFHVIKTDLSAQSLQKIVGISESVDLAPHVHTLHFRADEYGYLGFGIRWGRNSFGVLMYLQAGPFGVLQNMLRDKLINCRSFHIDSCSVECAYENKHSVQKSSPWLTPGDVVFIVCFMVARANLLVKSLVVEREILSFGQLRTTCLLSVPLNPGKENEQEMSSWRSLDSLVLRFDAAYEQYHWALNVLKNASALRSLRLGVSTNYNFFPRLAALRPFHALENLSLEGIILDRTALSRFLTQHGNTLRGLTLQNLHLAPVDDNDGPRTPWELVFGDLMGRMKRLELISIFYLFETYNGFGWRTRVVFHSLSAEDAYPVVPGSQEREPGYCPIEGDARVVASLESPIQLRYTTSSNGKKWILGVAYEGRQIDGFLALLIEAKKTHFGPLQ